MRETGTEQSKITGGFWKERRELNAKITMKSGSERFAERFEALKCIKKDVPTHIFWDSDTAKWLEAAAYVLSEREDKEIRARYEEAVADIEKNQKENGYFNSYFQVYEPSQVFTRRTDHELYCAGHLFEAAVAASEALGDDRLLRVADKFVDYIRVRFTQLKDTGFVTPGHEEIELALMRMYRHTQNKKYYDLTRFFIDERGKREETEYTKGARESSQSNAPVRELRAAEGHAVRALYLYTAMADLAKESGDEELKRAAQILFGDITDKKMYVTGGVGSSHCGERFSCAYDLPSYTAYAETCASIALALFCDRMLRLTGEAKYGDVFERALYNGILAGESLSGDEFFYVNPLEMQTEKTRYNQSLSGGKEAVPLSRRVKLFSCSCCPPNLCRFFAQLHRFIWYIGEEENEVMVAQAVTSLLKCERAEIEMISGLPYDGKVTLKINSFGKKLKVRLRKPAWSDETFENERDGYLVYEGVFDGDTVNIDFKPSLKAVYSDSRVYDTAGKVAFSYGPLILCAEEADNPFPLSGVTVSAEKGKTAVQYGSPYVVQAEVDAKYAPPQDSLYSFVQQKKTDCILKLIPYFAWANRKEGDMRVWFLIR